MKQFNGFEDAKKQTSYTAGEKLPVGAYVCKVLGVKYEEGKNGNSDFIKLQIDVVEGEKKDFFMNQYKANTAEDKKFKGQTTIYCPKDDGSEKDNWTKNAFARWINAFEASNSGYSWNWDEQSLKGKFIGVLFGETGTVIDGREIVYTEARTGISVDDVRNGKFKVPELKKKNGYTGNGATTSNASESTNFMSIPDGIEEEIPFN